MSKVVRYRKYAVYFLLAASLYLGLYVILSYLGAYVPTQSGELRYSSGLAATDVELWQPKSLWLRRFQNVDGSSSLQGNLGGFLFGPLIYVDRHFVHKTIWLFRNHDMGSYGVVVRQ